MRCPSQPSPGEVPGPPALRDPTAPSTHGGSARPLGPRPLVSRRGLSRDGRPNEDAQRACPSSALTAAGALLPPPRPLRPLRARSPTAQTKAVWPGPGASQHTAARRSPAVRHAVGSVSCSDFLGRSGRRRGGMVARSGRALCPLLSLFCCRETLVTDPGGGFSGPPPGDPVTPRVGACQWPSAAVRG